jgi:hypothetical protein
MVDKHRQELTPEEGAEYIAQKFSYYLDKYGDMSNHKIDAELDKLDIHDPDFYAVIQAVAEIKHRRHERRQK